MREWGPRIPSLISIEEATGRTPSALLDAPTVYGVEKELTFAFSRLNRTRSGEIAKGRITLAEISAFVELFGPPQMPMSVFIELLEIMDTAYTDRAPNGNSSSSNG